jgi:hypothetical protein
MEHSDFVDRAGIVWHIFAGLPANFPDTGEPTASNGPLAGLTFRSCTGEVRVLPRAAITRRAQLLANIPAAPGTISEVTQVDVPDWEELLRSAVPWPSA